MSEASSPERVALENAWGRFATLDLNANRVQRTFFRLRIQILAVGVAATALAIVYAEFVAGEPSVRPAFDDWRFYVWLPMIAAPILGSVLAAGAAKLARGVDWINLRGASEAIKREIYRYRCEVGAYAPAGEGSGAREERLTKAVGEVTSRLMDTEILNASLAPYRGPLPPKFGAASGDDGFAPMGPEQYLEWRLEDQHAYFNRKANRLDRQHRIFQWTIAVLGGVATLLAALGLEIWVPVAVGVSTALASYLAFRNVESNLAGYNRADLELDNIATWWSGLPAARKGEPEVFDTLVERTETVLGSENAGWVQQMQDAMQKLEKEEPE